MKREQSSDDPSTHAADTTFVCALDMAAPDRDFALTTLKALMGDVPFYQTAMPEAVIAADAQDRVVVFLRSPEVSLALALAEADDTARALDTWATAREALVARFRQARRRVTLVDIELFVRPDEQPWRTFCRRLGIEPALDGRIAAAALCRPSPIHDVAARMLIQVDQRAKAVAEELNLEMLKPGLPVPAIAAVTELLGTWKAISSQVNDLLVLNNLQSQAHDTLLSENTQARTKVGYLQENLTFVVVETEARLAELAALQATRDELAARLTDHDRTRNELALLRESAKLQCAISEQLAEGEAMQKKTIRDLREQLGDHLLMRAQYDALENRFDTRAESERRIRSLLGAQLLADARLAHERTDLRETLAEAKEKLATISAAFDDGTRDNEALKTELAKVLSSKSWRLTAPLRSVRRQLARVL